MEPHTWTQTPNAQARSKVSFFSTHTLHFLHNIRISFTFLLKAAGGLRLFFRDLQRVKARLARSMRCL